MAYWAVIGLIALAVTAAVVVVIVLVVRALSKPSTAQPYGQQAGP